MYNGIGLQTPRGSGTSGYIQANYSLNQKRPQNREKFLAELEAKRVNIVLLRTPTRHRPEKPTLKLWNIRGREK